jgi:hypothetical protein
MAQNAANQAAIAAMAVAQSEANHGRVEDARAAANTAAGYTNASSSVQSAVAAHTAQIFPPKSFENIPTLPLPVGPAPSSPTTSSPPPPAATPPANPWDRRSSFVDPRGVKQPDPSVILFDSGTVSPEYLIELEYEDISGMELINMSRSDLIDGQSVIYSPIKNLSYLRNKYNPNNIIAIPSYSYSEFSKYRIDLILRGIRDPYFDENGSMVIEIDDIKEEELIEVQIDSSGTINLVDFS